jgi:hypothetical protein
MGKDTKVVANYEMNPDGSWMGICPEVYIAEGAAALLTKAPSLEAAQKQLHENLKVLLGDDVVIVDRVM